MKIIFIALVCLLIAGTVLGQSSSQPVITPQSGSSVQDLPTPGPQSQVAPDAAVITIKGVCDKPSGGPAPANCDTVVTRAEFEKVIAAVRPNLPKQMEKAVAGRLAQLMILADKAHLMGLDQGPQFDEQMYLDRLQLLANMAGAQIEKDSSNISDADIEDYYKQHSSEFRTISYDKIYVPKQKSGPAIAPTDPDAQKLRQEAEDAMKTEADKLRTRADAGDDFVKLQQEAYDFAGMKLVATASNTHVEKVPRARMSPSDASIFDLKKGDVSQVMNDPQGFMIYKVDEVEGQPLADVKDEVKRMAQGEKMKSAQESLQKQVTQDTSYNDAYFAVPAPPSLLKPGERAPAPPSGASRGQAPVSPAPGKN